VLSISIVFFYADPDPNQNFHFDAVPQPDLDRHKHDAQLPIRMRILSQVTSMLKNKIFFKLTITQCQSTLNFPSRHQLIKLLSDSTFKCKVIAQVKKLMVCQSCSNFAVSTGTIRTKMDQDPDGQN
jgi:hypothetical protein